MKHDSSKHHRRSIRLRDYDYASEGAYFVTLCVQDRECLLGEIVGEVMRLHDYGHIAAECWQWLEERYDHVILDEWVVMPNHMHGIIVIHDSVGSDRRGGSGRGGSRRGGSRTAPTRKKPLGRLVGAFKTISTKKINVIRGTPGAAFWQRNYYEHVIRNEKTFGTIRSYIMENPSQWRRDPDNPYNRT